MNTVGIHTISALALTCLIAASGTSAAGTGDFELRRSSFSGSGGQSAGGSFTVQNTTSQPDAGVAGGDDFQVTGSIAGGDPPSCTVLATATGLVATEGYCPGVHLGWIDTNSHETGYRVRRDGVELAVTSANATQYVDTTAVPGAEYAYSIVATNACGDANASPPIPGHRPLDPVAPDNISISFVSSNMDSVVLALSWNDNAADETVQTIYNNINSNRTVLATLPPDAETAQVTLLQGENYCFEVTAENCGVEAVSDPVCIVTSDVPEVRVPLPPAAFALGRISPNPFRSKVTIDFEVPRAETMSLRVFDLSGRLIDTLQDGMVEPGRHTITWSMTDSRRRSAASGIYFVEMRAPGFREVGRLVLLR